LIAGTRVERSEQSIRSSTSEENVSARDQKRGPKNSLEIVLPNSLGMPPLRERPEDISMLVEYFIGRYARRAGKTFRRVSKRTLDRLQSYAWPGNVRELQNVIERSVIVSDIDEFTVDESWLSPGLGIKSRVGLSSSLAEHEKRMIEDALCASGGRVFGHSGAAARLGIPRSTLESKIRALKINKSRFRTRRHS
jgi:DNA-binding NtrC family response regulator